MATVCLPRAMSSSSPLLSRTDLKWLFAPGGPLPTFTALEDAPLPETRVVVARHGHHPMQASLLQTQRE